MLESKVNRNGERFVYQDKPEGEEVFKAEVYYSTGGINYFSYKDEPRGVYFSISPVKIEHRNGMTIESFMVGESKGMKGLVLPLERKSAKQVRLIAAKLSPKIAEIVELFKTDRDAAFRQVAGMFRAEVAQA